MPLCASCGALRLLNGCTTAPIAAQNVVSNTATKQAPRSPSYFRKNKLKDQPRPRIRLALCGGTHRTRARARETADGAGDVRRGARCRLRTRERCSPSRGSALPSGAPTAPKEAKRVACWRPRRTCDVRQVNKT